MHDSKKYSKECVPAPGGETGRVYRHTLAAVLNTRRLLAAEGVSCAEVAA